MMIYLWCFLIVKTLFCVTRAISNSDFSNPKLRSVRQIPLGGYNPLQSNGETYAGSQTGSIVSEGGYNPTSTGYNSRLPGAYGRPGFGQGGFNQGGFKPVQPGIPGLLNSVLPNLLGGGVQNGGGQTNSYANSESYSSQNSQNINVEALGIPIVNIGVSNSQSNSHSNAAGQSHGYDSYNQINQYG